MSLSNKRTKKRKAEILKSAMKIINRRGYERATMEEIAAELLMTKGSLYYYFKSKQDLMYQCHQLVLSDAIEVLELHLKSDKSAEEILKEMVFSHIHFAIEEKETYNLIIKPDHAYDEDNLETTLELRRYYAGLFDQVINKGLKTGEFNVREPLVARMFILGSMNWIQQWYNPENRLGKEQIQDLFFEYIIATLKGRG